MAPTEQPGKAAPRRAIIVAGPTCSGKSALALHLAERFGGTIINADSMQIYRELRIVTARPTEAEEALVPHRLYGIRPAAEAGSVAWWRKAALEAMETARVPILCGGTGMYLRSLTTGLADIPNPGDAARAEARALLADQGAAALHAQLAAVDPQTAATLRPSDGQRVARAWEVWRGTGRGLAEWLKAELIPADYVFRVVLLDPPRPELRAAIAQRFTAMLEQGAVGEVERLLSLKLDPALPAMQAHGVPELSAALQGSISLAEAERQAVLASAQYTKRQATWFRHQKLAPPGRTETFTARYPGIQQLSERWMAGMQNFLCGFD
jgi:tRNA dimethylallyltransferase